MANHSNNPLYAVRLNNGQWAVRPLGKLGTCGWTPRAWTVVYVSAASERAAVAKAERSGKVWQ